MLNNAEAMWRQWRHLKIMLPHFNPMIPVVKTTCGGSGGIILLFTHTCPRLRVIKNALACTHTCKNYRNASTLPQTLQTLTETHKMLTQMLPQCFRKEVAA